MDRVKLTRRTVTMDDFSQLPLNPHPVFPQWSTWDVYPNQYYGSMRKYIAEREYFIPRLENDFLRVDVNADIGGRIWRVHDKVAAHFVQLERPDAVSRALADWLAERFPRA